MSASGGTLVVGSTVDAAAWIEYLSQPSVANNLPRRIDARLAQEQGAALGARVRDLTIVVPSDPLAHLESCWMAR